MRCRLVQVAALATIYLLGAYAFAQTHSTAITVTCPSSPLSDYQQPSGPEISVTRVTFTGALRLPISDQRQIATSIKQRTKGYSLDEVTDEALERVRAGWQDRGYFKVQVSGHARTLTSSRASQRTAMSIDVEEGIQYRLGEITFQHNKAISDVTALRSFFPINDGDIFSREKIAMGLENLRRAYGELGYINFTSVPNTAFNDEERLASLDVDLDEGKQFHVSSIKIVGLDDFSRQEILKDFPVGQVYNERLFRLFLGKYSSIFKLMADDPRLTERRLDQETGAIAITLYACPCPVC